MLLMMSGRYIARVHGFILEDQRREGGKKVSISSAFFVRSTEAQKRDEPEVEHLQGRKRLQHPHHWFRCFQTRSDDAELCELLETSQIRDVREEVVVEVEESDVRCEGGEVGREVGELAGGHLDVDQVVALLVEERGREGVSCEANEKERRVSSSDEC